MGSGRRPGYHAAVMNDDETERDEAASADLTAPELGAVAAPHRDDCQRHIAQRVIAALRRGGINCCVVVTDREEPH
jgi:hypothetical protein